MSNILVTQQDFCLTILIQRPERKNALTFNMYQQMAEALEKAATEPSVRVVCIKGQGDCFTSGNDLQDFAELGANTDISPTVRFMKALIKCPKPVVAQVHGSAIGIGTTLLLHCDLVYCADNSQFMLPFINLALVPEYASSYLLPHLTGHVKAAEWLMLGNAFGADEACQCGLVNKVVMPQELDELVNKVCAQLSAKPQQALMHTKALLRHDSDNVLMHMDEELDIFIRQLESDAAKEMFEAFLQKRPVNQQKINE
ncbi:enoyl-CoA hydratase [Neptunicella marina]|uniref:Enoyl-CoA hydratase n=1 Tax=Neptunicella marina TaxID=2125989 RepID=A0A8J6M2R9_9ALTE|nr:enoyl-CoA hydratase [Neptunicella marina]MBC3766417.1 enoyl-CoA hydratase [Neptunicella marina]